MPTLNYTTSIPAARTVAEVQTLLGEQGAAAVAVRYINRRIVGVTFTLDGPHGARAFTLPVDVDAVHRLLNTAAVEQEIRRRLKKSPGPLQTREHAERVAWRTAKDWLEAQLALVQASMATLDQVMLPYLHVDGEITLYDRYRDTGRALTSGGT